MSIGEHEVEGPTLYPKVELRPLLERSAVIAGQVMGLVGLGIGVGVAIAVNESGRGLQRLKDALDFSSFQTFPDSKLSDSYRLRKEIR